MAQPTNRALLEHIHQLLHHDAHGLAAILANQSHIHKELRNIMATLADIKAQSAALIDSVKAETDLVTAIKTYVEGLKAQMTDLAAQLAAAIAAGGDPAALQAVSDDLTAASSTIDANKAAEAAVVNTDAAP